MAGGAGERAGARTQSPGWTPWGPTGHVTHGRMGLAPPAGRPVSPGCDAAAAASVTVSPQPQRSPRSGRPLLAIAALTVGAQRPPPQAHMSPSPQLARDP
ncbi:unnamed protein product [Rangifer tarandus platyrhynchus]|uniref:Uncharacterized protein n=2 Tax=Rangifer tarandus platyrhynchus TaxID=3082113 RepID=A0ABN8ZPZ4_RANTA|nr:unnamed protein product [Rangifer tarandus platyrhynchus]CAI9708366.1 unnamed protein product [Rangifer tarandus platyrhynchus]